MPLRAVARGLAVTDTVMLPFPVPEGTPPIAIQAVLLVAVQAQPVGAVTAIDEFPATQSSETAVLESWNVHDVPAWVTVTVWPATVTVPVRGAAAIFGVTENCARPPPARLLPAVIAIHPALLIAVQEHPAAVLTVMVPVPEIEGIATFVVESA
jgi:hypothetical protein